MPEMHRQDPALLGHGMEATTKHVRRGKTWRHMYGAFNVWLDTEPKQTDADAPQRSAYADAEVHMNVAEASDVPAEEAAQDIVAQV